MKGRIVRFLDNEDPTGSDKDAIRTSLEVSPDAAGLVQADVGTAPNEIPVNGMLGDMAYQSSDGVSAAKLEVESTTGTATTQALTVTDGTDDNFVVQEDGKAITQSTFKAETYANNAEYAANYLRATGGTYYIDNYTVGGAINVRMSNASALDKQAVTIDSSGRVGIGNSSPGGKLTIETGSGNGIQLYRSAANANFDAITFRNTTNTGTNAKVGFNVNELRLEGTTKIGFNTNGSERWVINSAGDLVSSGGGIDFGSTNTTAGVTVTGSTLDHYEEGTWTVTTNSDATGVIGASDAVYTRIGNIVTVRATFTVTTNFTSNQIGGLPYLPATNSISNSTSGTPVLTASATSSPIIAHVLGNSNTVRFTSGTNLGTTHALNTTHASYRVFLTYNV